MALFLNYSSPLFLYSWIVLFLHCFIFQLLYQAIALFLNFYIPTLDSPSILLEAFNDEDEVEERAEKVGAAPPFTHLGLLLQPPLFLRFSFYSSYAKNEVHATIAFNSTCNINHNSETGVQEFRDSGIQECVCAGVLPHSITYAIFVGLPKRLSLDSTCTFCFPY